MCVSACLQTDTHGDDAEVFFADGEASEQLCPHLFAKLSGFKLRGTFRCNLHAGQRSLENAISSDPEVERVIGALITNYSGSGQKDKKQVMLGGFARAVRNSTRLAAMFSERAAAELDSLLAAGSCHGHGMNFAPQRFDTILQMSSKLLLHLVPVIRTLTDIQVRDPTLSKWASSLLQVMTADNLIMLALLAELCQVASSFHHKFEQNLKSPSCLAKCAQHYHAMKQQLNKLFSFRSESGALQEPLCLSAGYSCGFCAVLQRQYNMLVSGAVLHRDKLLYYRAGTSQVRSKVAAQLGVISNIVKAYCLGIESVHSFALAESFQPFDATWWRESGCDDNKMP